MKRLYVMLPLACALTFTACDDYDDTALWEQVNDNTSRIEALEQWQNEVNNNIALMTDAEGNPIRANGEDGKDGEDGQDGADGDDGEDGTDGSDGKPGATGKPGASAPTPQIKLGSTITSGTIETDDGTNDPNVWYLSVDNGKTWYRISGKEGAQGNPGSEGQQGPQGDPMTAHTISLPLLTTAEPSK